MLKPNSLSAGVTRSYFKSQIYNFVTVSFGVQVGWNDRAECLPAGTLQLVFQMLLFRCVHFAPLSAKGTQILGVWSFWRLNLLLWAQCFWIFSMEWDGLSTWHVWGSGEGHTGFLWGNLRQTDHLEDPCLYERIILRWIFRKWDGGVDWIDLAQNRGGWRAVINAVVKLRVP
jgi:hypothetical protein